MKLKVASLIALCGITALSCNLISQAPNLSVTPTLGSDPASGDSISGGGQDNSSIQSFSLDGVDTISSEDVYLEVNYANSGGGWNGICINGDTGEPFLYPEPAIISYPKDTELMLASQMITCGWNENQSLMGTITYPDGRILSEQITATEIGGSALSFSTQLDDPIGIYTFEISNGNKTLQSNVYYYKPNVPRIYYLTETQLLFNDFPAGEPVQLLMFVRREQSVDYDPKGGVNYVVDNNGKLIVNIPLSSQSLFLGIDSLGVVYEPITLGGYRTLQDNKLYYSDFTDKDESYYLKVSELKTKAEAYRGCLEKINSSFAKIDNQNYQYAKVTTSDIVVYAQSRYTSRNLQEIEMEQVLELRNGPYCFENSVWWEVALPNHTGGYVIEVDQHNDVHLEKQECGAIPSRLSFQQWARAAYSNGYNKNIRKQPGFSADILTTIREGTQIRVFERWCVDNTPWWSMITENNQEGWMTEVQDGVYLLEPVTK